MRDIKKGNLGQYDIKKKDSKIVMSQFKFEGENEVLVTMGHKISLEKKKKL